MIKDEMGDRTITRLSYTDEEGERIDKFVASMLPHLSRARVQALIEQGLVTYSVLGRGNVEQHEARAFVRIRCKEAHGLPSEGRQEGANASIS